VETTLRRSGLTLGGSLENAIVIGETGVLNGKLRFEDECVATRSWMRSATWPCSGIRWWDNLDAVKGGHALHAALAQKLMATEGAWALVTHPQLPVLDLSSGSGSPSPPWRPNRSPESLGSTPARSRSSPA
jgi:UDP-3-O-[3-hydroxymyristoyl] N-acetylglucosamine deacetylase